MSQSDSVADLLRKVADRLDAESGEQDGDDEYRERVKWGPDQTVFPVYDDEWVTLYGPELDDDVYFIEHSNADDTISITGDNDLYQIIDAFVTAAQSDVDL